MKTLYRACISLCALFFVTTNVYAADMTRLTPSGIETVAATASVSVGEADVTSAADDAATAAVSATAYAVYDTQRFIASANGDAVLPMASTTKIMTALVAIETYGLDDTVTFDKSMTAIGSSMYLKYGEVVAVRDLLYGLMLMSGNDAARALASHYDGGEAAFVGAMNERARELGLASTSFANPNGLDAEGHYTTAKELALLTAHALKNPVFREIVSTKSGTFAGRLMNNHNRLLRSVEGCVGVKTGYTTGAGRCLVSAVELDGRDIIVVTLRDPNDWRDHSALHEWATSKYAVREVSSAEYTQNVIGGVVSSVTVGAAETVRLTLSADEAARLETKVYLPRFVYADVAAGGVAGRAEFVLDGEVLAETELIYRNSVGMTVPKPLTFGEKLQDLLETLAWEIGF